MHERMSSDQAQPNRQGESTSKRHREALPATEEFDENAEEFGDNVKNRKRSRLDNTSMGTALRWKAHQMAQDYVELASNVMLHPLSHLGPYGYALTRDAADGCVTRVPDYEVRSKLTPAYQLHHMSALGFLKSAVRRPVVIERWSPYEIAIFEASLAEYGKDFPKVKKEIGDTKTTSEVIEFYYIWKKTSHYAKWKKEYVPEYLDVSESDGINIKVNAKQKV